LGEASFGNGELDSDIRTAVGLRLREQVIETNGVSVVDSFGSMVF